MDEEPHFPPHFEHLIAALNRRQVRYVVIGGVAAMLQGWPLVRTLDLDITPATDTENMERLVAALRDVDAKLRAEGLDKGLDIPLDERTFTGMITMTFLTQFGPFDVCLVPDGTNGYDDLSRNAKKWDIDGLRFLVASVEDIKRSKMAAGREKDARHLRQLGD
jgi:hypothetical protein